MEKEVSAVKAEETEKVKRPKEPFNNVIFVQVAVCAFAILLIFLAGKLSPKTFEFLKAEYNRIMSVDMSPQELIDSAKGAADDVMGYATGEEETPEEEEKTEKTQLDGEGGEDSEIEDTAIAVMASLGNNDKIVTPLSGRITSRYGYRTNPISGKYGLHTGVDIAADEGTNIVAAYNGVIKDTGYGDKRGNYVLMLHQDGTQTLYCHCSKVLVDEGTVIRAGETIALVGSTGWSTGPHLHFEIRKNGTSTDPMKYIEENDGRV